MYIFLSEDSKIKPICERTSFLYVNLIIVTTRNHLLQHLAKVVQLGKNNMVKKTHTHKTK